MLGLSRTIVAVLFWIGVAQAADSSNFDAWLVGLRAEAIAMGVDVEILDTALTGIWPIARVIELDRRQPEGRLTAAQYLERVVPSSRQIVARQLLSKHRKLLKSVAAKYGVQPRFIVALWGIETDFGRNTGGFGVVEALATLAYDGRRADFFRSELLAALQILDERHIAPAEMRGSWAGAMGQSQFMPSSFLAYAVDENDDGRRDIWKTLPDVFASIANYLTQFGWEDNQTWGRAVRLPTRFDKNLIGLETKRQIGGWQVLGVRRQDGRDLPTRQLPASIVQPDGQGTQAYMVYENFATTLRWNRSTYFALAVGKLADSMIGH